MRVSVIPAAELDGELVLRWRQIQATEANLASPFFCPEFTMAAAEFYPNTYVGVIEEGGSVAGFLPFERQWGKAGRTVAYPHCDYHGTIIDKGIDWSASDLVNRCGLRSFEFEHLIVSQEPFRTYHAEMSASHVIDLRCGYAAYHTQHRARRLSELARQATREVGPLRLEIRNCSAAALGALIAMKRRQYARLHAFDVFSEPPLGAFLERLQGTSGAHFSGLLTILYMGDRIAAAHFGLRSRTVWHWWYPTYEEQFVKYSPGLLLLQQMIEASEGLGIAMIDLGYGDEQYKLRVANSAIPIVSGRVGVSVPSLVRDRVRGVKQCLSGTRLERPALAVYRGVKRTLAPWLLVKAATKDLRQAGRSATGLQKPVCGAVCSVVEQPGTQGSTSPGVCERVCNESVRDSGC